MKCPESIDWLRLLNASRYATLIPSPNAGKHGYLQFVVLAQHLNLCCRNIRSDEALEGTIWHELLVEVDDLQILLVDDFISRHDKWMLAYLLEVHVQPVLVCRQVLEVAIIVCNAGEEMW